jgi:Cu-processing system permease protein
VSGAVRAIAGWEFRLGARARWILAMGAAFALLAGGVTLLALGSVRSLGSTGIGPSGAALVNLGVLLPSLMGLLLAAGSLAGERDHGMLTLLLAQPVRPGRVVLGVFLGLAGSLWATLGIGYGLALLLLSPVARGQDVLPIAVLVGSTFAVAAAGVAVGAALAAWSRRRLQAVALATALWIALALGFDLAIAAIAPTVHLGPGGLLVVVLLNPLEAGRILALLGMELEGTALGPFGAYLLARFGTVGAVGLLAADLIAWAVVPLGVATLALSRRDL